jgi:hypothetical protein
MSFDQLQGNHGTIAPAAIVDGAHDASRVAAGDDQDREGGEPPADATTDASAAAAGPIPGFPADLLPIVGPAIAQAGADAPHNVEDSAPAALPYASGVAPEPPQGAPDDALVETGLDGFDGPDLEAMPVPDGKTIQYTMVANVVLNRWQFLLTPTEFGVVAFIIRQTHGFQRVCARIAMKQFHDGIFNQNGEAVHNGAGISHSKAKEAIDELELYGLIVVRHRKNPNGSDAESEYYVTNHLIDGWRNFPLIAERVKARKEWIKGRGQNLATGGQRLATRGGRGQDLATRCQDLTSTGGQNLAPKKNTIETRTKKKSTDSHFPSFGEVKVKTFSEGKVKVKVKTMAAGAPVPPQPRNEFQEGFRDRIFAAILKAFPGVYTEENRTGIEACCDHPIFVANWRTIIHKNRHLPYGDPWPFKKKDNQWNFLNIHQRVYDSRLEEGYKPLEPTPWERFSDHKMTLEFRAQAVGLRGHPEFREEWLDWIQSDQHEDYKFYESMYDDQINSLEQQVAYYENLIPEKRYSTRRNDLEDRAADWLKKPEFREEWERRLLEARANPLDHGPLDWLAQQMIGGEKKFDDRENSLLDRADAVGLMNQPEFRREWRALSPEADDRWWDQRALDWLEQQVVLFEQAKRSADELAGDERILAKPREDSPGDVELRRDGEHRPEAA